MRSVKVQLKYIKKGCFFFNYMFVLLYVLLYASKKRFFPIFQHNERYKKNKNVLNKLK